MALCACGRIGFDAVPLQAVDANAGDIDSGQGLDGGISQLIPECEWVAGNSADFLNATPLQDRVLSGIAYFSLRCTGGLQRVSLWFEPGAFGREPDNQHILPPFDLETAAGSPVAIDTALLHSGEHSLTAWGDFDLDGPAVRAETATFQIQHIVEPRLVVSMTPDRMNPVPLDGLTLTGTVYVSLQPGTRLDSEWGKVEFFVDGASQQVEGGLPYDLAGGSNFFGDASPFDLGSLTPGVHTLEARVPAGDAGEVISAVIQVN